MIEFKKTSYLIKLYDKGAQYGLKDCLHRFEIRTKRMEYLKSTGIKTLGDLLDFEKYKKLSPLLVATFNKILIYDKADESKLGSRDKDIYLRGINEAYWSDLKPERRIAEYFGSFVLNSDYKRQRKQYDDAHKAISFYVTSKQPL